ATLFATVEVQTPQAERDHAADAAAPETIAFDEMRRRLCDDAELIAEVTSMFLEDCPERLAEIEAAVIARDRRRIRVSAHALKGAACNLSAGPVARCAHALEQLSLA